MLGDARVTSDKYPLEHSPLKNISHINGGRTENGKWITYKSNSTWITFTDMNIQGVTYFPEYSSNHNKVVNYTYLGRPRREPGAAGCNALHVGGNVTWYDEKDIRYGSPKSIGVWIMGGTGTSAPAISPKDTWWMFPRTD